MEIVSSLMFSFLTLTSVGIVASSTVITAEGNSATLRFTIKDPSSIVYVDTDAAGDKVYLAQTTGCTVFNTNYYNLTCINNTYSFKIIQVTLDDDERQYGVYGPGSSDLQQTVVLKVYSAPNTLNCDAPHSSTMVTDDNERDVIVKCSTDKVYPKAQCAFKLHGQTLELQSVTYNHPVVTYDGEEYYKSSCTLTYHVTSPDSYAFDVDMYVNINGNRYGSRQTQTTQLNLSFTIAAAEGNSATLRFTAREAWFLGYDATDGSGDISYLAQSVNCLVYNPILYNMACTGNDYRFTIIQVTREDERQYDVYEPDLPGPPKTFHLKVYSAPSTLICDAPRLSTTMTDGKARDVIVKCSTDKVYPKAECAFKLHGQTEELQAVSYNHPVIKYDGMEYYQSSCTLTYNKVSSGSYAFDVEMYLNIDGRRYGNKQRQTSQLNLTLPTAVKSPTCPEGNTNDIRDGYIRNGSTATCLCTRDHPGLPQGKVMWYMSNGNNAQVSSESNEGTSSRLTIRAGVAAYVCNGTSDLGIQKDGVTYTPKFAYGPTSISAPLSIGPIDLCTSSHKSITINYSVSVSDVAPYPLFMVTFDGQSVAAKQNGSIKESEYIFTQTLELTSGGKHDVYCKAKNAVFPDISVTSHALTIDVEEPPRQLPFFWIRDETYEDRSNITVDGDDGSTVVVACQVNGGYPPVSSVTLKCGNGTTSAAGAVARHVITISKDIPVSVCSCSAQHVTNCYVNKSDATLNFTFKKITSSGKNIAAIAGGVAAGILLITGIISVIIILKRKGMLGESNKKNPGETTKRTSQAAYGSPYENALPDTGDTDVPYNSHYDTIPDETETRDMNSLTVKDVSDNYGRVEYENTVMAL